MRSASLGKRGCSGGCKFNSPIAPHRGLGSPILQDQRRRHLPVAPHTLPPLLAKKTRGALILLSQNRINAPRFRLGGLTLLNQRQSGVSLCPKALIGKSSFQIAKPVPTPNKTKLHVSKREKTATSKRNNVTTAGSGREPAPPRRDFPALQPPKVRPAH
jgi:hypothetical protein